MLEEEEIGVRTVIAQNLLRPQNKWANYALLLCSTIGKYYDHPLLLAKMTGYC